MRWRWAGLLSLLFVGFSEAAEPKYKLGDIPDTAPTRRDEDEDPRPEEIMEQKFQADLHKNIAEYFFMKGKQAMTSGNKEQAEAYFDRVLILVPNHEGARAELQAIVKSYDAPKGPAAPLAPEPSEPPQSEPIKKMRENPAINKEKSNKLYIEALAATQEDHREQAIKLCQQALALDPSNQQAERMLKRLIPVPTATPTP